jgi:hypothetical protein
MPQIRVALSQVVQHKYPQARLAATRAFYLAGFRCSGGTRRPVSQIFLDTSSFRVTIASKGDNWQKFEHVKAFPRVRELAFPER